MGVGRRRLVGVVVVAVLAAIAGAAGAATGGAAQQTVDADTVSLWIGLGTDGSADWRVTYRVELETDNETGAFDDLAADVAADPGPYLDRFGSRMRRAMWTAENATGRGMAIENVTVDARTESLPQATYGVVVYRFEWVGFAPVAEDGTVTAGDAIDEFFLDERTSLTVAWPDEYGLAAHEPTAAAVENGSVTWQGRRNFGPGEPRVVVAPGAAGETPGAGGVPLVPVAAVVVLLFLVGGWLYRRRGGEVPLPPSDGGGSAADGDAPAGDPPADDLLSNEERVLRLLESHGGRLKQQQVAAELDWTDAKTSQVVSDLREAGDVESFRLGRENVLTLPDVSIEPGADGPDGEGGE